ncbi:alpha/beta hydrolase [Pedobacter frigoris]|uniref:alpha/beta hydrolase n=1 Tax=Pedobacter frigoris TaxID=2571272 RepID=UPI0029300C49|nr:alpha/beta fold hydrolase [Pedobacter frigoris]
MTIKITNKPLLAFVFFIQILLFTNAYAINPQREYSAKPDAIGLKYETNRIKVNNSVTLNSWACLQQDLKKPFIIISGTDAGNMSNSLGQAQAFYDAGYNVILYDYRGFGESSDFKMDLNAMYYDEFAEDLAKTIAFVEAKYHPGSIVLYGQSMGTIISRKNADTTKLIKGLVLDSFVIDPKLVVERIFALKKKNISLPSTSSAYIESNKINIKKPVLLFSGLKDIITKTADYEDFLSKNPNSKIVTWDCNHLECFTSMGTEPNLYMKEFNSFVTTL